MKYHELNLSRHKTANRVGRGIAAGQGKTAGRGTKGQNSRTGSSKKPGFEGGQNPLMQRMPKMRGFNSHKVQPQAVYTGQLSAVKGSSVNNSSLSEAGIIDNPYLSVKLITKGSIDKKFSVQLQSASASAIKLIEDAGGSFEVVDRPSRPITNEKRKNKRAEAAH